MSKGSDDKNSFNYEKNSGVEYYKDVKQNELISILIFEQEILKINLDKLENQFYKKKTKFWFLNLLIIVVLCISIILIFLPLVNSLFGFELSNWIITLGIILTFFSSVILVSRYNRISIEKLFRHSRKNQLAEGSKILKFIDVYLLENEEKNKSINKQYAIELLCKLKKTSKAIEYSLFNEFEKISDSHSKFITRRQEFLILILGGIIGFLAGLVLDITVTKISTNLIGSLGAIVGMSFAIVSFEGMIQYKIELRNRNFLSAQTIMINSINKLPDECPEEVRNKHWEAYTELMENYIKDIDLDLMDSI